MSGVAKGIGKVFKKVGSAVKKIAPVAAVVGAVALTGGAASGLLGTAGAAASGAATQAATGGGFLSSLVGSFTTAGTAGTAGAAAGSGVLGKVLSSEVVGQALLGAASGYSRGALLERENEMLTDAEDRIRSSYDGVGEAVQQDVGEEVSRIRSNRRGFAPEIASSEENVSENAPQQRGFGGLGQGETMVEDTGIAVAGAPADAENPTYKPPRVPVLPASAQPKKNAKRYQYNPETKRIEYA